MRYKNYDEQLKKVDSRLESIRIRIERKVKNKNENVEKSGILCLCKFYLISIGELKRLREKADAGASLS